MPSWCHKRSPSPIAVVYRSAFYGDFQRTKIAHYRWLLSSFGTGASLQHHYDPQMLADLASGNADHPEIRHYSTVWKPDRVPTLILLKFSRPFKLERFIYTTPVGLQFLQNSLGIRTLPEGPRI